MPFRQTAGCLNQITAAYLKRKADRQEGSMRIFKTYVKPLTGAVAAVGDVDDPPTNGTA